VAAYGTGFSRIAVLPLPDQLGRQVLSAARAAAGTTVALSNGTGTLIRTPLLSVLLASSAVGEHDTFLLTGLVTPALLDRAGSELLANVAAPR
jgi:hypothetical protein